MLQRLRRRTLLLTEERRRQRYNCDQQEDPSWQRRADAAVNLWREHGDPSISPLAVGDFGAGSERLRDVLVRSLDQDVEYFAYDLQPQLPSTRRLDLAREVPASEFDVVFSLGVLEYLSELNALPARLRLCCRYIVVSYIPTDWSTPLSLSARRSIGWRSHLAREEFQRTFTAAGFTLIAATETDRDRFPLWLWQRDGAAGQLSP